MALRWNSLSDQLTHTPSLVAGLGEPRHRWLRVPVRFGEHEWEAVGGASVSGPPQGMVPIGRSRPEIRVGFLPFRGGCRTDILRRHRRDGGGTF